MRIKICGVQDPEIATFAAQQGAHYIGIVLTPGFRRSVTMTKAQEIVEATHKNGAIPVGVFVAATSSEIASTCHNLHIELVQAYQFSSAFPAHLKRIFINEPNASLRPHCDFLLMESKNPGSGEMFDMDNFSPPTISPWWIAGGLTPENVKEVILRYRPDGVDVSTGVEKDGVKNRKRIAQFIQEVKSCE